jgi:hypothetical protein
LGRSDLLSTGSAGLRKYERRLRQGYRLDAFRSALGHAPVRAAFAAGDRRYRGGVRLVETGATRSGCDAVARGQAAAQGIFDQYGVRPAYVVDYPVAVSPGAALLRAFHDGGRCLIGAHLHPWVNPPLEEPVTPFNSYPGNLAPALERRKLEVLTEAIEDRFGVRPLLYKAGRYGIGPATAATLEALGYLIDLSVVPRTDYGADGGPDFRRYPDRPYWFGTGYRLLEIPMSRGLWSVAARHERHLVRALTSPRVPWLEPACTRVGLVQRLALSPEGFDTNHHRRLVRGMLLRGHRVFTLTYHSPSLLPGNTPYVRSGRDLGRFLDRIKRLLGFFLEQLGGAATTPLEIRKLALAAEPNGQCAGAAPALK